MSTGAIIGIILQTVVILLGIFAAFIRTERRITAVETKVDSLEKKADGLASDHGYMRRQVNGISRSVARLEGRAEALDDHAATGK